MPPPGRAEQVAGGAVDLDQPVGALVGGPLERSGGGEVTLRSLAQHRAGYPRLAGSAPTAVLGLLRQQLTGGNPYGGWTPERMVDAAAGTDPDRRTSSPTRTSGTRRWGPRSPGQRPPATATCSTDDSCNRWV